MAEKTVETKTLEREYIIPLRKEWRKTANYRRTGRAVKAIKKFIARHMKVPEHDVSKVKLDQYLNQEVWFRGSSKPPAKIKVKAIKEGDIVRVELAELPAVWKFDKARQEKKHKAAEKIKAPEKKSKEVVSEVEQKAEETRKEGETPTEEKKQAEKGKEQSVADVNAAQAKQQAKAQKHTTPVKETGYHRTALKK